jgi:glycosyltransferase involved in cell wall biosynthesis
MDSFEVCEGISIHRPAYLQLPRVGSAFWIDRGAFFWCRGIARELHRRIGFDAILSFDLLGTGGVAWRLGQDLRIPASGWAFGTDMRQRAGSWIERVVTRAIKCLDLVFYQSEELLEIAARSLGIAPGMMSKDKHVVLSHGIPEPPSLPVMKTRGRVRSSLGIGEDKILLLNVGTIRREKGVFELLEAMSLASARDPRICCVLLGSRPALDEAADLEMMIDQNPALKKRVKLLPACAPAKVWEYLCAADIFAFASHKEGMPNSLLEAMAMGLPSIAFAIPPIREIEAGTGGLVTVPPMDVALFSEEIARLAASPEERARIGGRGRDQVMERFMVRKNMAEAVRRLMKVIQTRALQTRSPVLRMAGAPTPDH